MADTIFYVEKVGVYRHGVHWAGTSLDDAKLEARKLADMDRDSYHEWEVRDFPPSQDGPLFSCQKE